MAVSGVALTVTYLAYDVNNNVGKTGDLANHTLRLIADGVEVTVSETITEVDATNAPGLYSVPLTAAHNTGTNMTLCGKSATSGIIIVPTQWQNGPQQASLQGTASAGGASTITVTGGVQTDNYYKRQAVTIVAGAGAGQTRRIVSYVGSTRVATVGEAWVTQPDSTSVFVVWNLDAGILVGSDGKALISTDAQDLSATLAVNAKAVGGTTQTGRDLGNALPTAAPGTAGGVAIVGSQMDLVNAPNTVGLSAIASAVWGHVTRTLSAFGFNVTVGTNNDKSGYSLTTPPPTTAQIDTELAGAHGAGAWNGGGGGGGAGVLIALTVEGPSGVVAGAKVSLGATEGAPNVMHTCEDGTALFQREDGSYACSAECQGYLGSMATVVVTGGAVTSPTGGILTVSALPAPSQVPVVGKTGSSSFGTGTIPGVLSPDQCLVYVDFKQVAGSVPVGANEASIQAVEVVSRPAGTTEVFSTPANPAYCDANGVAELAVEKGAVVLIQANWPTNKSAKVTLTVPDQDSYDLGADLQ